MGNSESTSHERDVKDKEEYQHDAVHGKETYSSDGGADTAMRDISPVESKQDEAGNHGIDEPRQSPSEACYSENLLNAGSSALLGQESPQLQADARPWNMARRLMSGDDLGADVNVTPVRLNREDFHGEEESPRLGGIAWQPSAEISPDDACLDEVAEATCSFLSSTVARAILGEDWLPDGHEGDDDDRFLEKHTADLSLGDYTRSNDLFFPSMIPDPSVLSRRRLSDLSATSENDLSLMDFCPPVSQDFEWMGRSIEMLILGHRARAPVLALPEVDGIQLTSDEKAVRNEGTCNRRSPVCSLDAYRSPHRAARRISLSNGARFRYRNSSSTREHGTSAGPNVLLSLLAREETGKSPSMPTTPPTSRLREMGGTSLYNTIDAPAGGMISETALLKDAIECGDWTETQIIVSRLAPRLVGDMSMGRTRNDIDDPSLPASAPRFHAGGGRLGLEREAFVLSGGVRLLIRIFTEPAFVGDVIRESNDARDLSDEMVTRKLASCWNEVFASLRELVYALPILVENGDVLGDGDFLPFLFTLLAHEACFDGAAALIEEILSAKSNSAQQMQTSSVVDENETEDDMGTGLSRVYIPPASTFFMGNVPDLYELVDEFNCRQLAHFCRILALLIFEPEDRQVLESPSILKSLELLQLRRDRAARSGRDAAIDMNQAILLGNPQIMERLMVLLRIMNFAPPLSNSTPYHVMAHFPFIAGTLPMVGLNEINDFSEVDRLEHLAKSLLSQGNNEQLSDLGAVTGMLESLSSSLHQESLVTTSQIGHIINVINAATQFGVVVGMPNQSRPRRNHGITSHNGGSRQPDSSNVVDDSVASASATLTNSALLQGLHPNESSNVNAEAGGVQVVRVGLEGDFGGEQPVIHRVQISGAPQMRINSPEDAANELQFNAYLLAPYQVEVLFVLCSLLGGRRKIDAQNILRGRGLMSILEELFHRLPFGLLGSGENASAPSPVESHGIHGPGCECTPESAMSVQFLRLLHNFCDRDCDNHTDRRLLLSAAEHEYILPSNGLLASPPDLHLGLLSKVIQAFISESDDSPYRFWLASCVESFLRGSSVQEQLFVAQSGLLAHLLGHVTSERIHCAGSLQTSFDLLGELCKGNVEMLRLLMSHLDEKRFWRLMNLVGSNLVDSNVFVRSLILTIERDIATQSPTENSRVDVLRESHLAWRSKVGPSTRCYLTHSWWDLAYADYQYVNGEQHCDDDRPSDWFHPFFESLVSPSENVPYFADETSSGTTSSREWVLPDGLDGRFTESGAAGTLGNYLDNNRTRLLRDLLRVVDLETINHENICCLNTAIVLMIFAHRRGELREMVEDFKALVDGRSDRVNNATLGIDNKTSDRSLLVESESSLTVSESDESLPKEAEALRNFRELLWFWSEYYSHRGRDRISIEFSSRLHFDEWQSVVSKLCADDGSSTALLGRPTLLPRSPYQCLPRVSETLDGRIRGT